MLHYGLFTYRGPKYVSKPETSGVKNDLQSQGSAGTYLMKYSFCGATGMTAALPPDKNGAITPRQAEKMAEPEAPPVALMEVSLSLLRLSCADRKSSGIVSMSFGATMSAPVCLPG